jgi:ATP-dependent RNA helicase DHX57
MYDADPFAAKKALEDRQAAAEAEKERERSQSPAGAPARVAKEYANAPEVRMSSRLREMFEEVVKRVRLFFFWLARICLI